MDANGEKALQDAASSILGYAGKLRLSDANEAETRFKVIDQILHRILGWQFDDISVEERVSEDKKTTYSDYILRTANASIIVEAKRIGASFEISGGKRKVVLGSLSSETAAMEAIRQARDYCRKKSIPFAAVTNGAQWIVFPAVRTDQVSFEQSTAIVFDSLEVALGSEIHAFRSLLSRDGVIDSTLESELLGRKDDQFGERRLRTKYHQDSARPANPVFPLIELEVNQAFSDSIDDRDKAFFELCYVNSADRRKFDSMVQMHLRKQVSLFDTSPTRPLRPKDRNVVKEAIEAAHAGIIPLALLILGSVGSGKTTFLNHTRKVSCAEFFNPRRDQEYPHWIYVDFRSVSPQEDPLEVIYDAIFEYLKVDEYFRDYNRAIGPAYESDIESLMVGPLARISKDKELFDQKVTAILEADYYKKKPYVDKLVGHAAKRQPVYLVVDNVDQYDSETHQAKVFADAIAVASRLKVNLVLPMRETTFVRHRGKPIFDAFDFDNVHIEPPEIPAVLSRRFLYLTKMLDGKEGSFTALNGAKFKVENLAIFVNLVQQSVLGTNVGERIDILANKDVRLALRMTREFLQRGYSDPAFAIEQFRKNKTYVMPKHEAFRAILLGNQAVYSEAHSVIGNPFDARLGKSSVQLLRLFVLSALVRFGTDPKFESLDGTSIKENCRKIGFGDEYTLQALRDLCKLRFVHTMSYGPAGWTASFAATRLGGHIIRDLLTDFTFLENVLMDTFIDSAPVWEEMRQSTEKIGNERDKVAKIKLRVSRVKAFWSHIASKYLELAAEAQRRGLAVEWCSNPFKELDFEFSEECSRVVKSASHHYGKS